MGWSRSEIRRYRSAGFIGSHLAETLQDGGHEVLGVDSFTDYYARSRKERNAAALDVLEADLSSAPLKPILAGADGVFHLAGQPGVRASWGEGFQLYLDRNVRATQRLFEASADAGIRVVFASSSSVYGDAETYPTPEDIVPQPISPYGITKLACEQLAVAIERARGLEAVVLRYFTVYGPRQRPDMAFTAMLEALTRGERFRLFGDGSAARSFTYVATP
jgi:nucleoside-diphosphate-sugar epimerase